MSTFLYVTVTLTGRFAATELFLTESMCVPDDGFLWMLYDNTFHSVLTVTH